MTRKKLYSFLMAEKTQNIFLILLGIVGSILIFIAAYGWRYTLGGDAIAYISIAEYYAEGSINLALNAYWAPMISWLIVPFILLGFDGQLAFLMLNAAAASSALVLSMYLVWSRTNRLTFAPLLVWATTLPFYLVNIKTMNPDMLVVLWVVIFAFVLIKANDWIKVGSTKTKAGVALGLIGAAGFLTKAFIIPLFTIVSLLWFIIFLIDEKNKRIKISFFSLLKQNLKLPLITLITLVLVCSLWVISLSVKYGEPILSSSFEVNIARRYESSKLEPSPINGVVPQQLSVPPHDRAVIWGEDPAPPEPKTVLDYHNTSRDDSVLLSEETSDQESKETQSKLSVVRHYVTSRIKAFPFFVNRVMSLSPFIVVLMLAVAFCWLFGIFNIKRNKDIITLSLVWLVYFIGYAGITNASSGGGNLRYYWPLLISSTIILGLSLPLIIARSRKLNKARKFIITLLLLFVPFASFTQYILGVAYPFSIPINREGVVIDSERKQPRIFVSPQKYKIQRVAEDIRLNNLVKSGDDLLSNYAIQSRLAAFHLDAQSYDRKDAAYQIEDESIRVSLDAYDIEYFLHFASVSDPLPEVEEYGYKIVYEYDLGHTVCNGKSKEKERCTLYLIDVGN